MRLMNRRQQRPAPKTTTGLLLSHNSLLEWRARQNSQRSTVTASASDQPRATTNDGPR